MKPATSWTPPPPWPRRIAKSAGVNARDPEQRPVYLAAAAALAGADSAGARTRAVALFESVARDSNDAEAKLGLAYALARIGNIDQAEAEYRSILAKDDRNIRALNELSCILSEARGDNEAALQHADRGLALEPGSDFLLDTRGAILSRLPNRLRESRTSLEKAAVLRRNQPAPLARTILRLAAVCLKLDDRSAARRATNELRELNQKHRVLDARQLAELEELTRQIEEGAI
jgi:tetratricopeptide (TPR) repeat protein